MAAGTVPARCGGGGCAYPAAAEAPCSGGPIPGGGWSSTRPLYACGRGCAGALCGCGLGCGAAWAEGCGGGGGRALAAMLCTEPERVDGCSASGRGDSDTSARKHNQTQSCFSHTAWRIHD